MKKLAHIAKHSHNIGEGALVNGLRNQLLKLSKEDIKFIDYDRKLFQSISGAEFSKNSVNLKLNKDLFTNLNKSSDALIIGGGGIIQTGEYENFGGLCVAGNLDDFNQLKIPVFVYAIGDNRLKSEYKFKYIEDFKKLVSLLKESGGLCSVRNDGSHNRLSELVNDDSLMSFVEVIPDPGLFIQKSEKKHPLIEDGKINIAIQLAGDRIEERLVSNESTTNENQFLESIAKTIHKLSLKHDLNVIVCPHIPTDFDITSKFIEICSGFKIQNSSMTREIIQINYCTKGYNSAPDYFSLYDQCDLALGMRGHSAICCVGLKTPFIGLNSHEKLGGFLEQMNLGEYSLSISDNNFYNNLNLIIENLLNNRSDWDKIRDNAYMLEEEIAYKFNKKILNKIT